MKMVVIGGGSTYTPELAAGLLERTGTLPVKELWLHDIDRRRLEIVAGLVERMNREYGSPLQIYTTDSTEKALVGADFVITQIRVGGQQARHDDTKLCLEAGMIGQETTGPAGFAKALRTIPVILDLCRQIRRLAPDAWLLNFTNPAGLITEAVLRHGGVKIIGLCNAPINLQLKIAQQFSVPHRAVELSYKGLNHLSFVDRVWVQGRDVTAAVMKQIRSQAANIPDLRIDDDFYQALNLLPSSYLNYFFLQPEVLKALQAKPKTRAEQVMAVEAKLLEHYEDPALTGRPPELEKRGGAHYSTAAVELIQSIYQSDQQQHIVNVENRGAIPDLPAASAVEVTCAVSGRGAVPLVSGGLPAAVRGLVQHVKAYEELTVEAAAEKSWPKALLALSSNPLVYSVNRAKWLLEQFDRRHNLGLQK